MLARRSIRPAAVAALVALTAAPTAATARGDDDARVRGTCGAGATAQLRLRADDGTIRVEFEVRTRRGGERWRVVLVHERRVAWQGRVRTRSGSGTLRVRRRVADLAGVDEISARASGPGGNSCAATARLIGGGRRAAQLAARVAAASMAS